jgi:ATP-binding cassette subfamily F protein uup
MSPLISLTDLSKTFGIRPLFQDISLVVSEGDRTALIGPNGAGKSTLFKIIAGTEDADTGKVSPRKGLHVGYVPQVDTLPNDSTIEEVLQMTLGDHTADRDARIAVYSGKVGFLDIQQRVSTLSGGWRKRLAIACALIKEPELLLLDEPTNHLDIDSILWLEELLLNSDAAVVFVSHDRYFIERIATKVIELDRVYPKGFLTSEGSYSDFLETRETYLAQQQSYKESLTNKVRREIDWLRQGAKARRTKAKGRIQQAGELIQELGSINLERKKAEFEFSEGGRRTKELITLKGVSKSLSEKTLFKNLTVTLAPGVRLGLAGSNGTGKTTLLKTLLGTLPPDTGSVTTAHNLRIAYFDQKREELDPTLTLKKALCPEGDSIVFGDRELHVVTWARRFLFSSDHLALPISSLSGGERARVLLARLMAQPADVLVLDEPTNDLDIPTLEVLEETLCEFSGAVVLVTHDRHLLDRVSTQLIGLSGDGGCEKYADYSQWEAAREERRREQQRVNKQKNSKPSSASTPPPESQKPTKLTYAERLELEGMEARIAAAELEVAALQEELSSPEKAADQDWLVLKCDELALKEGLVEQLFARWQDLEQKRG